MKPLRTPKDKVLLKAVPVETNSAIIAPTDIDFYEVVAVGSKVDDVKVGDKVFYHLGAKLTIHGSEYISVTENDIQVMM